LYGSPEHIYRNIFKTCRPKGKTYRDAQLGELVHSVVVENVLEHKVICGSEPVGEKHGEGETAIEQQPPQALGYEATTSSWG
jgi:hypothetical protein